MTADFQAVESPNWDEMIHEDDDDENSVYPREPRGRRCSPSHGNGHKDGEGKENMQSHKKRTGKDKGTKDVKGKWAGKGKGKGNNKGKGIVEQTPQGEDISWAIDFQLQKEMYEADTDMES
jgi:hypothetical protein